MPLAIAGLVAGSIGAIATAGASKNASKTAEKNAAANNALLEARYQDTRGLEMPGIQRGEQASDLIGNFLGLGGDPAKSKAALDTYLNSTGFKFKLDQGVGAITSNRAAAGILDSGATLKAISNYGQNTAAAGANDWLYSLSTVANRGAAGVNALAGVGTDSTNAQVANTPAAADAKANAGLAGASSINSLLGNALGAFAYGKGASSYGGGSAAGARPDITPFIGAD